MKLWLSLAAALHFSTVAFGQTNAKIPDPDPELERKTFVLPEGFEVNLWAADPLLAKPIQMNFDSKGRLWIAASEIYPQIKPGQKANDKILILEDTTGKGVADKTTVFADGLLIPTGVEPDNKGGAYVAASTELVYFSEPDAKTGKATKKRTVLSGFGTEDTHHILHTLRTGLDGMLYMNQSVYIHSHIETPHGVRRLNAGGIWQYRPETEQLEVFARGWWNSWGTTWNKWGTTFATDGAGGQGINYVVPGAWYEAAKDPPRILPGLNPGSPKYCGLEVVSGRHLPDDWQQNLITNDFRGHRVCRYVIQEDGAGFVAKEQKELIKSTHPAFRPIDVKMGPDGAIYIADWYNPIIQHGEVDFRDERRDKTHGRIWRITAKGRPLVEKPKIAGAKVEDLLEMLKAPEDFTRWHAKRELKERGPDAVLKPLQEWLPKQKGDQVALEALWVRQSLDAVDIDLLSKCLRASTPDVRASACRVAGEWARRHTDIEFKLPPLASDENPRVRLEAVRALVKCNPESEKYQAPKAIAAALDKPIDRWLDYAIWLSLRETKDHWLPDFKAGKFDFGGDPKKIVFALNAVGEGDVMKPLVTLLMMGKLTKERQGDVLAMLAALGGPNEIGLVFDQSDGSAELRNKLFPIVEQAVRTRKVAAPPGNKIMALTRALESDKGVGRQAAARLMGLWKLEALRPLLEKLARAEEPFTSSDDRRAAQDALVALGGVKSTEFFRGQVADGSAGARRSALVSLVQLDTPAAAKVAADLFAEKEAADLDPVFAAFIVRKGGPAVLAKALADKTLSADVAKIGIRVAKANGQGDATLIAALTKAGKLADTKREFTKPELDALLADVKTKGDPVRGEAIYRRAEFNCLKCHAVAGAGGLVGPDMTSLGASAQVDYLVESLLKPNAKVKEGYNSIVVTTDDDRVFAGVKIGETPQTLTIRDAEGKEIAISKADKPAIKPGLSLMPDGLTDALTRQEFIDLVRFLSELGKGPYLAQPGKVVRTWQTVLPTKELFTAVTRDRLGAIATDTTLSWAPVYSMVGGDLPTADLVKWNIGQGPLQAGAKFQLDCTTAGKVALKVPSTTGLQAWLDGAPLDLKAETILNLSAGMHIVTFSVKLDERKVPLRVELDELKDSPARVRIVGGK